MSKMENLLFFKQRLESEIKEKQASLKEVLEAIKEENERLYDLANNPYPDRLYPEAEIN